MQTEMNRPAPPAPSERTSRTLRVMTYNVHSCRGTDRRLDPARIADVIAQARPDVIALQELDVGRARTGGADQAHLIAERLRMVAHFHPALHLEEEKYGDAILTALPSRLIKAGPLPSIGEPRGAIWIEISVGDIGLQVVNTHLGLRRRERWLQANALLSGDWLGSERCRNNPTIFLGDLNAIPTSAAYALIANRLDPVRGNGARRPRPTFPSRLPLLRLDHIFVNDRIEVSGLDVPDDPLSRKASDHLPLVASLVLPVGRADATPDLGKFLLDQA